MKLDMPGKGLSTLKRTLRKRDDCLNLCLDSLLNPFHLCQRLHHCIVVNTAHF